MIVLSRISSFLLSSSLIRPLCSGSGGQGTAETTQATIDFLAWAYPRSEQMVLEAAGLPRP